MISQVPVLGGFWKGSQSPDGAIHPSLSSKPRHPIRANLAKSGDGVTLDLDPDRLGLIDGDHLLVRPRRERRRSVLRMSR